MRNTMLFIEVMMNLLCELDLRKSEKHFSKRLIKSVNPGGITGKI